MKYIIIILINTLIMLGMFLYFRHKINKHLSGEEAANAIRDELENLVRDINRITMRNSTIIETKISELRTAIQEGEKCIVSLVEKTREKKDSDELYKEMKMASIKQRSQSHMVNPVIKPKGNLVNSEVLSQYQQNDRKELLQENKINPENKLSQEIEGDVPIRAVNINEKIITLHRQGVTTGDIAKQVSKPHGEVEMIIELYS